MMKSEERNKAMELLKKLYKADIKTKSEMLKNINNSKISEGFAHDQLPFKAFQI